MRWAGKGNAIRIPRIIDRWDTLFAEAPASQPYLNSWVISPQRLDSLRLGDPLGHADRRKRDLDPYKTIEVSVPDWEDPKFAEKFTNGIVFRNAGREKKGLTGRLWRDVFEAFDPESTSRFKIAKTAGEQFDEPLDAWSPVVRIFGPKKELPPAKS
jgi:hypothetical protein